MHQQPLWNTHMHNAAKVRRVFLALSNSLVGNYGALCYIPHKEIGFTPCNTIQNRAFHGSLDDFVELPKHYGSVANAAVSRARLYSEKQDGRFSIYSKGDVPFDQLIAALCTLVKPEEIMANTVHMYVQTMELQLRNWEKSTLVTEGGGGEALKALENIARFRQLLYTTATVCLARPSESSLPTSQGAWIFSWLNPTLMKIVSKKMSPNARRGFREAALDALRSALVTVPFAISCVDWNTACTAMGHAFAFNLMEILGVPLTRTPEEIQGIQQLDPLCLKDLTHDPTVSGVRLHRTTLNNVFSASTAAYRFGLFPAIRAAVQILWGMPDHSSLSVAKKLGLSDWSVRDLLEQICRWKRPYELSWFLAYAPSVELMADISAYLRHRDPETGKITNKWALEQAYAVEQVVQAGKDFLENIFSLVSSSSDLEETLRIVILDLTLNEKMDSFTDDDDLLDPFDRCISEHPTAEASIDLGKTHNHRCKEQENQRPLALFARRLKIQFLRATSSVAVYRRLLLSAWWRDHWEKRTLGMEDLSTRRAIEENQFDDTIFFPNDPVTGRHIFPLRIIHSDKNFTPTTAGNMLVAHDRNAGTIELERILPVTRRGDFERVLEQMTSDMANKVINSYGEAQLEQEKLTYKRPAIRIHEAVTIWLAKLIGLQQPGALQDHFGQMDYKKLIKRSDLNNWNISETCKEVGELSSQNTVNKDGVAVFGSAKLHGKMSSTAAAAAWSDIVAKFPLVSVEHNSPAHRSLKELPRTATALSNATFDSATFGSLDSSAWAHHRAIIQICGENNPVAHTLRAKLPALCPTLVTRVEPDWKRLAREQSAPSELRERLARMYTCKNVDGKLSAIHDRRRGGNGGSGKLDLKPLKFPLKRDKVHFVASAADLVTVFRYISKMQTLPKPSESHDSPSLDFLGVSIQWSWPRNVSLLTLACPDDVFCIDVMHMRKFPNKQQLLLQLLLLVLGESSFVKCFFRFDIDYDALLKELLTTEFVERVGLLEEALRTVPNPGNKLL